MEPPNADSPQHPQRPRRWHRPLIPVFAGLIMGIAVDGILEPAGTLWILVGAAVGGLVVAGALYGLRPWANWVLALALAVPIGGASHYVRFRDRPPWHLSNLLGDQARRLCVRGVAGREPEQWTWQEPFSQDAPAQTGWRFPVKVTGLSADQRQWVRAEGGLTVLGSMELPDIRAGDELEFLANVRLNRGPTNPGEDDFRKIFDRMGSVGTATVASALGVDVLRRPPWYASPRVAIGRLRSLLKDRLIQRARPPVDGLTGALIFGERGRLLMPAEPWPFPFLSQSSIRVTQRQLLSETGSLHFLAISGLHVGLFAALVAVALNRLRVRVGVRPAALIALIWLYVLFTGMQVSAQRAAWMLSFVAAAPLFKRRYDLVSGLMGAGLLILVVQPQELFTAGFQLTFLAVWAIVYLYPELSRILWPWETLIGHLQEPSERSVVDELKAYARHYLLFSACIWFAVVPVTAYHFHHYSLWTPLVNLAVWPLVLLLILAAFLLVPAALTGAVAAAPFVWATAQLSAAIQGVLGLAGALPGFVTFTAGPPLWWIGAFYGILALWVTRKDLKAARVVFLGGVLLLAAGCVWMAASARTGKRLTVTVVDVGHGQSIVFRLPSGAVLVYDAGSSAPSRVRGVVGVLRQGGAHGIHAMVVSHRDSDHCNFVPALDHQFPIRKFIIPPLSPHESATELEDRFRALPADHIHLVQGGRISAEGLDCTAVHPDDRFLAQPTLTENDLSLVLLCAFRGWKVLLTGDARQDALHRLTAEHGDGLRADILVLPHHGIWADGLRELAEAVRPAAAVASCPGALDERTQQMLDELNIPVWRTAQEGAIILELAEDELVLSGFVSGRRLRLCRAAAEVSNGRPTARSTGAER